MHRRLTFPCTLTIGPSEQEEGAIDWVLVCDDDDDNAITGGWAGRGPKAVSPQGVPSIYEWAEYAQRNVVKLNLGAKLPWSRATIEPAGYAEGILSHSGVKITFPA